MCSPTDTWLRALLPFPVLSFHCTARLSNRTNTGAPAACSSQHTSSPTPPPLRGSSQCPSGAIRTQKWRWLKAWELPAVSTAPQCSEHRAAEQPSTQLLLSPLTRLLLPLYEVLSGSPDPSALCRLRLMAARCCRHLACCALPRAGSSGARGHGWGGAAGWAAGWAAGGSAAPGPTVCVQCMFSPPAVL